MPLFWTDPAGIEDKEMGQCNYSYFLGLASG